MIDNENLTSLLKSLAIEAVESLKLSDWCYGMVSSVNPLRVSLNDKLVLRSDFIEFGNYDINNIETGDKLILLRKQGGQLYLLHSIKRGD